MTEKRNKLLIEVGAYDGTDSLCFYEQMYKVYTFEPKTDLFLTLKEKTKELENYTVINKAVSLIDGEIDFNICKEGGASSILSFKPDEELINTWGSNRQDIHYSNCTYKVKSTRLDTFIEENQLTESVIDYLHIDAQGADLDVLKSMGVYINNVKEGVIESAYSNEKAIYVNQNNTLHTATKWLIEHGFIITNVKSNDGTNCECNIFFKKETK
jgi:FkbM family methyltransferase